LASLLESIRKRFNPDTGLRVRMSTVPGKDNEIGVSSGDRDITTMQIESNNSILDASDIDKFVTLSQYRDQRYQAFEEMLSDPIVAAALEMYADDSTQYNRDGNIIWAESDDPVIAEAANRLIRVLDIQNNAWRHIYSLCTYGDLFLRLYKDGDKADTLDYDDTVTNSLTVLPDDNTRNLEERIEYVHNPATVFDLQEKDRTTGFIKTKSVINASSSYINHNFIGNGFSTAISTIKSQSCQMLHNKSFVHIMLSESINRTPEYISVENEENGENTVYKIKTGKSALEDAYPATRRLDLLEDSITLSRLSKSAIIRLLQVEVGDAPKPEGENILRRVKNLVEQKMSVNTDSGKTRSYNSPGPIENTIYVPTKNGKGAIEASTIGGDVDIKSIADIEYFQNLKLAALKIPKQFLNFDSAEGFSNGTSLTKVSSRYAHTIMRIQTAYIKGITTLLNIFFIDKGLDYVNKFKLRMVSPSTVEDAERDEQLNDKISQTRDLVELADDLGVDAEAKNKIFVKLLNDFVGIPEISNIVNDSLKKQDGEDTSDLDLTNEEESEEILDTSEEIAGEFDDLGSELDSM